MPVNSQRPSRVKREARQHARRLILLVSFLLFPITIFYFSPVLIIEGALSGAVVGSALVFALQFLQLLHEGAITDAECIQCAACADVCPKDVLRLRMGRMR